jgi:hypothetical protein
MHHVRQLAGMKWKNPFNKSGKNSLSLILQKTRKKTISKIEQKQTKETENQSFLPLFSLLASVKKFTPADAPRRKPSSTAPS